MNIASSTATAPTGYAADALQLRAGQARTEIAMAALKGSAHQDRMLVDMLETVSPDAPRGSVVDIVT